MFLKSLPDFKVEPWLPEQCTHILCFSFAQTEQVERNYIKEKKAAVKEFEDKKVELKENLIAELEEKKKMIENEKLTMELTGGMKAPERGVSGGGIPVNSFCLVSQFLMRAEQAKKRVGFDMTGQISNFVFIGCVTLVKPLNFFEPISLPPPSKWGSLYPISCDYG